MNQKKMKQLTLLVICVFFTVGCKTVMEEEKKEEEIGFVLRQNDPKIDSLLNALGLDSLGEVKVVDDLSQLNPEMIQKVLSLVNEAAKRAFVSVFPNPTSSSATIKVDFSGKYENKGFDGSSSIQISGVPTYSFRYDLIFDDKVIHRNEIKNINQMIWHEIIPEHLLQKNGVYVVVYEMNFADVTMNVKNTINFMVVKQQ